MGAWNADKQGAHTVLLERDTSAGRKPCAEGILSEVLNDAEVSPQSEFAAHRITGAYLYPPDEKKRGRVRAHGYILDKPAFLTSLAARAGAAVPDLASVTPIHRVSRPARTPYANPQPHTHPL